MPFPRNKIKTIKSIPGGNKLGDFTQTDSESLRESH